MGTWNTAIDGNDTFLDIYQNFFVLYNQGVSPGEASQQIQADFADMFNNSGDRINSLFGLAKAQWETKALDPVVHKQVKEIIENGADLESWKGSGADEKTIKQRKAALDYFLTQLTTEREKPKRRSTPQLEFGTVELVNVMAPDNLKMFLAQEIYSNKKYEHTVGMIRWEIGGGSVLSFIGQGKFISALWADSQTLEITHDKDIVFSKKDDKDYFMGDSIKVIYKAQ